MHHREREICQGVLIFNGPAGANPSGPSVPYREANMLQLPPIPSWDSIHPAIVHFPIALLLLSPLFILISAILPPSKGRPYMTVALVITLLGTISLFVAASSGEAAAELAERSGKVDAVLAAHEDLASETRIVFAGLSAILLG